MTTEAARTQPESNPEQKVQPITNIKAYSQNIGVDVLAAFGGEYQLLQGVHHISALRPYQSFNGGPQVGQQYTLAYDLNGRPQTLKNMTFEGQSHVTGAFRFAG